MSDRIVRVANGQGFWGDSSLGPIRLVEEGPLDYLTLDYLAEVTMSILRKQQQRDPEAGYARDFVDMLRRILPTCRERGIKVIANAGGVNPRGCADAVRHVIRDLGLQGVRIGVVDGDDIFDELPELIEAGESFTNLDTGAALSDVRDRIVSANVYIGARPIADALDRGADIVITGRASDPSVALAPLIHEFGWSMDEYDKLAAGTILGHTLECGAQCTGGNYVGWRAVSDFARIGYPVAEVSGDGSFVITKHEGTGGLVNVETVTSQLLYEMSDPENYLGPDCVADFTSIQVEQDGTDRVHISGIKGRAPTSTYKVSMAYNDGYKIVGQLVVTGPDAVDKANLCAGIVFERMAMHGVHIPEQDRFVEMLGTNTCYKGIVPARDEPHELLLRVGARGEDRNELDVLGRELAPLVTAGPPGLTGFAAGRPKASAVIGYWPALIDKSRVETSVAVEKV